MRKYSSQGTSVMLTNVKYLVRDWPTETWSKLRVASDETPWSDSTKMCGYLAEADKFIVLKRLKEANEFPPYLQTAFPLYVRADFNKPVVLISSKKQIIHKSWSTFGSNVTAMSIDVLDFNSPFTGLKLNGSLMSHSKNVSNSL